MQLAVRLVQDSQNLVSFWIASFYRRGSPGQISFALSPLNSSFDVVYDGGAAASMISSGTGDVLCKFAIAVDDYQTAIRQLQCEGGAVDR